MDVKSKLASNMRNQVLKQYKLNETKRELKKKDSKITSIIYYNNEQNVLVGYNNGKLKRAENLSAVKAGNLTDTTIKKDGERLSPVQINDMNKTYRQIWQFEGETYGVKPGKIERLENGGGDITNIGDVKGWDPEFQSKLEIFQMINTGYECPDISKDLHMNSLNAWNSNGEGQGIQNGIYKLRWNTPLPNTFIDGTSYELYFDIYYSDQCLLQKYNILSTINNEKRDRMLKVFNIPRSFGYELVDKSKRLEMGYYCKDKKVFKTHFDNKKFISNEKMINKIDENYYKIMSGYYREGTITEPKTLGKLITNYTKNKNFDNNLLDETLVFRYFQNIKDYLNETDSNKKVLMMMVSRMKEYEGGGKNIIKYDNLIRFNRMINYAINHPHFNGGDQSDIDRYDDNNKEYLRKARNYEIVTSSEMIAIMPTSPNSSFAETFCDLIGWGAKDNIAPSMKYHECLTNVEWFDSPYTYIPKSITFAPEYEC